MAGFTSGLFWGAVFGGLAGLMRAPRPGYQTRKLLKLRLDQATSDVNDVRYKVDKLGHSIQRLGQEGLSSLKEASDDIQSSLKHFQDEASPRINRIEERGQQLSQNIEASANYISTGSQTKN